jgi:2,4-dienoyl-CoA reductase-like NADH-dependent reductase (Old Yellow Enzyme family)
MKTGTALALRDIEILFSPFIHRKIELTSRLVMAPMTRHFATDGIPTPEMARYYRRRAEHELGLIITEGTTIDDPAAAADCDTPCFFGGAALRGWKHICRSVHATNCKIIPQLWHVGMARPTDGSAPNPQ